VPASLLIPKRELVDDGEAENTKRRLSADGLTSPLPKKRLTKKQKISVLAIPQKRLLKKQKVSATPRKRLLKKQKVLGISAEPRLASPQGPVKSPPRRKAERPKGKPRAMKKKKVALKTGKAPIKKSTDEEAADEKAPEEKRLTCAEAPKGKKAAVKRGRAFFQKHKRWRRDQWRLEQPHVSKGISVGSRKYIRWENKGCRAEYRNWVVQCPWNNADGEPCIAKFGYQIANDKFIIQALDRAKKWRDEQVARHEEVEKEDKRRKRS